MQNQLVKIHTKAHYTSGVRERERKREFIGKFRLTKHIVSSQQYRMRRSMHIEWPVLFRCHWLISSVSHLSNYNVCWSRCMWINVCSPRSEIRCQEKMLCRAERLSRAGKLLLSFQRLRISCFISSHVYKRYLLLLYVIDMPVVSVSSLCSTYLFLSANFFRPRPHINLICRSSHYSHQILRAPSHTSGEKPKSVHFIKIKCKKGQNESEKCAAIARDESIFPFVLCVKIECES